MVPDATKNRCGNVSKDLSAWLSKNELPEHVNTWTDSSWRASVRRSLLRWFRRESRDLPWRQEPTPYRVWVSEIMLQQTQVATVIDYYHRFMDSFPTVRDLAEADLQKVLTHWEGLGYYRRARSLHAASQKIMEVHGGEFPTRYEDVLALPGIGRYTAGAILSISLGQRLPILEGNTQRVFSRWIASRSPVTDRQALNLLWKFAEVMLPTKDPGAFNQGAMELGALICRPTSPNCGQCPVKASCQARLLGLQEEIPGKVKKLVYEDREEYAFVVRENQSQRSNSSTRYLVRRLPEGRRWAGLWDFPRTTEQSYQNVQEASRALSAELGIPFDVGADLLTLKHAVTRFRIKLHVYAAACNGSHRKHERPPKPWRFATLDEINALPMSVTGRKIAERIPVAEGS